jgi:hypothetical protein
MVISHCSEKLLQGAATSEGGNGDRTMKKVILVAALVLTATSGGSAQEFNPGTVVGNVLQNPASGCGYGFGYSGPGCGYYGYPPGSAHYVHRRTGGPAPRRVGANP